MSVAPRTVAYGRSSEQVGDLRLPAGEGPWPVAVLLHGGFWRERYGRGSIEPLAVDLTRRGFATWSLEYRRVGASGGGWPRTAEDVAAGIDHLADLDAALDLERVAVLGHSAGGQLAVWSVRRTGVAGAPRVRPAVVVSLAGVMDLVDAALRASGDPPNPTTAFLGGPPGERPDAYAEASPIGLVPLGVPQVVVQGLGDDRDFLDWHRAYVAAARAAGDRVEAVERDDADHFSVIDPVHPIWAETVAALERLLVGPTG